MRRLAHHSAFQEPIQCRTYGARQRAVSGFGPLLTPQPFAHVRPQPGNQTNFEGHLKKGSVEEQLFHQIDCQRIPRHVAIIMDGNGRWAQKRRLPRVAGHRAGIHSVRETVETAARFKMQVLTLYAFSVENWKRPAGEVATLMSLLKEFLRKELKTLLKNNIRFETLGRINELDPSIQKELALAKARTAANTGLLFNVALNYGGRAELVDAVKLLLDRKAHSNGSILKSTRRSSHPASTPQGCLTPI